MRHLLLRQIVRLILQRGLEPLERVRSIWPTLLPGAVGEQSEPMTIDATTLLVHANTPAVKQELLLLTRTLLSQLHTLGLIPEFTDLNDLNVRVQPLKRSAPMHSNGPRKNIDALMPIPFTPIAPRVRSALEQLDDPELRAQLERISRLRAKHDD